METGGFFSKNGHCKVYLWTWTKSRAGGRAGGVLRTVVYRTALPVNPRLSFSQARRTVYWRHCGEGGLVCFYVQKVEDCFKWRRGRAAVGCGGGLRGGRWYCTGSFQDPTDRVVVRNASPSSSAGERRAVLWTSTLSIFLHAGVHTPPPLFVPYQSLFLQRGWFNPKAFLFYLIFSFWDVVHRTDSSVLNMKYWPWGRRKQKNKRKKTTKKRKIVFPEKEEHLRCLFVTATAFVVVFWLKLFCNHFFSLL